jgi:hypothetical protein
MYDPVPWSVKGYFAITLAASAVAVFLLAQSTSPFTGPRAFTTGRFTGRSRHRLGLISVFLARKL